MQSDEVKRMLEAAAAQPSGPLDAGRVLRTGTRLRRNRLAAAAAGVAVVVAGASASFGILGTDGGPGPAGTTACETGGHTAVIYLERDASSAEVADLRRDLEASPGVTKVEFTSEAEALEELTPWLIEEGMGEFEAPPPGTVPASFEVEARSDAAIERIGEMWSGAIDEVMYGPRPDLRCLQEMHCRKPPALEMSVFLEDDIPSEDLERLMTDLAASEDTTKVEYFSKRAAYLEFKKLYEDQPELYETVPEDALPASIRVTAADLAAVQRLHTSVGGRDGVDEVKSSYGLYSQLCGDPEAVTTDGDWVDLLPEETPTPTESPRHMLVEPEPEYPVFTDGDLEVELVSLACSISPLRHDGLTLRPTGRWCGVEVKLYNKTGKPLTLDSSTQILETTTRYVYPVWDRAMRAIESARRFLAVPIEPGERRAGLLFFHLPGDAQPASVQIAHDPRDRAVFVDLGVDGCSTALDGEDDISCSYDVGS